MKAFMNSFSVLLPERLVYTLHLRHPFNEILQSPIRLQSLKPVSVTPSVNETIFSCKLHLVI